MNVTIATDDLGPYFQMSIEGRQVKIRPEFNTRHKIGLRTDLLAKAVGYKKNQKLKVIDATAGLCRDADHLASLGCEVIAIESHPQIYQVVNHYVNQTAAEGSSIQLLNKNSIEHLQKLASQDKPDVVYLDPMFPVKSKSAKSGKESELLKNLAPIASHEDEHALFKSALRAALKRVVVKRPLHAPTIVDLPQPSYQVKGKAVRYDVYLR